MNELGYVYCKGKWVLCETCQQLPHNYRKVRLMAPCCFEHTQRVSILLVQPTLWSNSLPLTQSHPLEDYEGYHPTMSWVMGQVAAE